MSNWIFDMFGGKDDIKKEAELTNKEKEWERKVEAHDWVNDVMSIDEEALAKEASAKRLAEERAAEPVDTVGLIMAFEQGDLDNDGILKLFSELIRTGQAWSLQGSYGRAAKSLIDQGYIDEQGNILKEINAEREAPDAVDEQQDPDYTRRASKKSTVTKIAAFEKGDTQEETNKKDYDLKVKGLSDYNLAEMLAEYEAMEKGIATLSMNEYKEDALKSVKSSRDAAEKKLIKFLGTPAILDWKKAFKEMEDSEVKFAAEKDLYTEWKEGKMAWEKKEKFEATTEKEKLEQMDGVGGEEEKGQVGKEASKTEFVKCPNCDSKAARKVDDKTTCVTCDYDSTKGKEASLKSAIKGLSKFAFLSKTAKTFEMLLGKYVELDAKDANEAMAKAKQMFPDLEVNEVAKQMGDDVNRKFKMVFKKRAFLIKSGSKFFVYMTNVVPIDAPNEAQALDMARQQFPDLDKVSLNNEPSFDEAENGDMSVLDENSDVPLPAENAQPEMALAPDAPTPSKRKKKVRMSSQIIAATPVEKIEKKIEKLINEKIEEAFAEMEVPAVDPMAAAVSMPGVPTVTEDSPEDKVLDKLDVPHMEPGETPEHEEKEIEKIKEDKPEDKEDDKEASLKVAAPEPGMPSATLPVDAPESAGGYHGWSNFESYMVAVWLDNDRDMKSRVEEMAQATPDAAELAKQLQSLVEESKPDLGATAFSDLMNYSLGNVNWQEVANSITENPEQPEVTTPDDAKPPVGAAPAEEATPAEIKPASSKKDVLKKIAEIDSPWKVVKNDKGEEIIARVAPAATTKKSKEKDKDHGINSQDLK